ncbi:uncharacterized protein LOC113386089 [Ctenocephalides felis]|uniref:uncharacterized protein LOC113386089 n=1 Tax=Ctenocephalides felis TaxID=7515 RepID=UPI000E6E202E|nr:uncharacterized protein LOC113386089 [Ctenocephalides felis]
MNNKIDQYLINRNHKNISGTYQRTPQSLTYPNSYLSSSSNVTSNSGNQILRSNVPYQSHQSNSNVGFVRQQFPGISQERFFPHQSLPENINHIQPQQAKNKNFIAVPSGSQYNTPTSAHESQYNLQGSEKQLCQGDNYYIQVSSQKTMLQQTAMQVPIQIPVNRSPNIGYRLPKAQVNLQAEYSIDTACKFSSPMMSNSLIKTEPGSRIPISYKQDNEETMNVYELDQNKIINKARKSTIVPTAALVNAINLHKNHPNLDALFEIYGSCVNIRAGRQWCQKIILLRDYTGPVMQVSFYEVDTVLDEDILPGDSLRVMGKMSLHNFLQAYKIRKTKPDELQAVSRLYGVSLFNIKKMYKNNE